MQTAELFNDEEQEDYDRRRTARLNALGVDVVRYANRDVLNSLDGVCADLLERIAQRRRDLTP